MVESIAGRHSSIHHCQTDSSHKETPPTRYTRKRHKKALPGTAPHFPNKLSSRVHPRPAKIRATMPLPATHDIHLHGSINGHEFDMVGGGKGDPNAGSLVTTAKSTKGALKFSPYLMIPHLGYGYYQYLPYPDGPSPFQTSMLEGSGYAVYRVFDFEDGGKLTTEFKYSYEGSHIKADMKLMGSGFPDDGPVMTSQIVDQDGCVSKKTYLNNNTIVDSFDWSYNLQNGKRYRARVSSHYIFDKPFSADLMKKQPVFVYRKCHVKATKTEVTLDEREKAFYELA
ncbi:red fluorescent protein drFP583-like [Branchiostoma floridae x Branchiostoma japonicum]